MSSIRHLSVLPRLPTTLAHQTHVDLPGYDIWLCNINVLYVVPAVLDTSRFEDALSRTLQLYPHAAGQYRYVGRRWLIELTNTAVPVAIDYKLNSSPSEFLDGGWVIQDDLSPFTDFQPTGANAINGSGPLVRIKLTFFDSETCVGISWNHSLGDATVLFRFLHTLSQFYQGLIPEFAEPSFKKHQFSAPSDAIVAEFWPHVPHFHNPCDLDEFRVSPEPIEHVRWSIDSHEIDELCSALSPKKRNGRPSFSKQDCITAYLVAVLNHARTNPVQTVRNTVSYRHVKAPFIAENGASNLIMDVFTKVPTDMVGIATAVRNTLVQCREPEYIHGLVTLSSNIKLEAMNAGKAFLFPVDDDEIGINSQTVIDWCSAHFGSPEGTQFHMSGWCKNAVRFNRSNPVKGVDGVWRAQSRSVDLSLGVAPEMRPKVVETLARGVRYMLNGDHNGPAIAENTTWSRRTFDWANIRSMVALLIRGRGTVRQEKVRPDSAKTGPLRKKIRSREVTTCGNDSI